MIRPNHGGNLVWGAEVAGCSPDDLLDFSASINPLGPPQSAIALIPDIIKQVQHYPNPDYFSLRQGLAHHHHITPEQILPANGAAELFTWSAYEGSNLEYILLPRPCFSDYYRALETFNIPIKTYNLEDLSTGLTNNKNAGLIINNPHNPTGKLWQKETLKPYLDQFALVVVDEAFMDFISPLHSPTLIDLVSDYDNLIVVRSLTKFYSIPGLRLGYAITNPERVKRWQKWRDPWSVNIFASMVGETVIKDHKFQQQTYNWLSPARNYLQESLTKFPQLTPLESSVNFLLVKSTVSVTKLQFELLIKSRILIRDCLSFQTLGDNFFRVAVRTNQENERLIQGLAAIV